MIITPQLTDSAVLGELGERLKRRRIDAGLTQARLAEEAGVSKRTVERIMSGQSTDFVLLLRVLRVLKLLDALDTLIPDQPQSPLLLLKSRGRERNRVGHARASPREPQKPASSWKWRE